ncbi:MAG: CoA-binding protein [Acidobacteria bacterium]|nr:CoA-binding protein [Acidobacteriota bacterium]
MTDPIREFLSNKTIAVAGVSRSGGASPANSIFRKLRGAGYRVYPVNPNAETVEGVACYPDVKSLPDKADAVMIVTTPAVCEQIVRQCREAGIRHVWMHRSFGRGSVSDAAVRYCRENGISVIPGGCPMMHCEPVDFGHKCVRWVLRLLKRLPLEPQRR